MDEGPLPNPLTLDERAVADRVFSHDFLDGYQTLGWLFSAVPQGASPDERSWRKSRAYYDQGRYILRASQDLRRETLVQAHSDPSEVCRSLDTLVAIHGCALEIQGLEGIPGYHGNLNALYLALSNALKNSKQHGKPPVTLSVTRFSGAVSNPLYSPPGAEPEGEFVRFAVNDKGKGFDGELRGYLDLGVTTKTDESGQRSEKNGIGLPLVLVCAKYLRNFLQITSSPGDTTVALYHPL